MVYGSSCHTADYLTETGVGRLMKEGGDSVSPLKRYFVVPFYPIISEVRLWQEVVNNPLACQDAFRDDKMWVV